MTYLTAFAEKEERGQRPGKSFKALHFYCIESFTTCMCCLYCMLWKMLCCLLSLLELFARHMFFVCNDTDV